MTLAPTPIQIFAEDRLRVPLALVALALVGATAVAGTGLAQSDEPTVRVVGGTVSDSGTTSIDVALTTAPDGLAGYYLRLSVEDADVARIEGASYPDGFGVTTEPRIEDGGRTVTLEAADLDESIQPGAADVTLATVEVAGVSPGETSFSVEPIQFDADGGSAFEPAARSDAVTVTPSDGSEGASASASASGGGGGATAGDGGAIEDGEAGRDGASGVGGGTTITVIAVAAMVALLVAAFALGRRR